MWMFFTIPGKSSFGSSWRSKNPVVFFTWDWHVKRGMASQRGHHLWKTVWTILLKSFLVERGAEREAIEQAKPNELQTNSFYWLFNTLASFFLILGLLHLPSHQRERIWEWKRDRDFNQAKIQENNEFTGRLRLFLSAPPLPFPPLSQSSSLPSASLPLPFLFIVVKYTQQNLQLNGIKYIHMAVYPHPHPCPQNFSSSPTETLSPLNTNFLFSAPHSPATTIILSVFMILTTLSPSCKQNHRAFVFFVTGFFHLVSCPQVSPCCCILQNFLPLLGLNNIPLWMYHSLVIPFPISSY